MVTHLITFLWMVVTAFAQETSPSIPIGGLPFEEQVSLSATSSLPIIERIIALEATSTTETTTHTATLTPPVTPKPRLSSPFGCSCVMYVRSKSKFTPPKVFTAREIPALIFEPRVGSWLLWKEGTVYSKYGHVSYVETILPDGRLFISEHNFEPCKTTTRIVDPHDPLIKGYFFAEF